ncbi:MAG: hypothetical protein N2512_09160 [Armatimonadetes bacterium]|nr:hypothetical protein [Armatimonadota bacterium]
MLCAFTELLVLAATTVVSFTCPSPQRLTLPNSGFEEALAGSWEITAESGRFVGLDENTAHSGKKSLRFAAGKGAGRASLCPRHLIRVRPGEAFKVTAFGKAEDSAGETCLCLDGYRGETLVTTLARSHPLSGTTPGWVYLSAAAAVPADGSVTRLGVSFRSDDNAGTVWFDDVALYRLPPDEPVVTGPPPDPPHGQIVVRDGHLAGEGGRRVRLWGINCPDEPNRTYREITFIARRIRQMGFNAVRQHIYDFRFIDTEATNERGERTSLVFRKSRRGDGSLLDKLDYFIYCCQREGLYMYMTFDRLSPQSAFGPGDYDVLPAESDEDRRAWQEALAELQAGRCDEHAYYVDPRLGEAQARFVAQVLDHRNAYTGRRVADDPYVALYELTNENHFPEWALQGGFRKWPRYFQDVLQKRWNAWLRERYENDDNLRAGWGQLGEDESLARGSVKMAPILSEAADYPPKRLADVHRFIYDLFVGYSRRLEKIIRSAGKCSARAPVSWDTLHEHKHKWYYPCSLADLMTVGVYQGGPVWPDREMRRISRRFEAFYNFSYASVLDKPMVVYETNTVKPDYWRADYPMLVSSFASTHDWDGVFWYCWADGTVPDEFDADTYWATGLRYAATTHLWHGIVTSTDEVLLASLRLAGTIFLKGAIPATPEPVVLTVGAEDLLGPALWIGDVNVPYPSDAPGPYRRASAMAATDFLHTIRYRYDMDAPQSSVTRPLIARLPQPCRPVEGLTYDWDRGAIVVDRPSAKAVVGFVGGEQVNFTDGVSLWTSRALDPPFLCFGLVSTDGHPLSRARRALLVLTTYGENRGRQVWAPEEAPVVDGTRVLVKGWGYGPPDIARPGARIRLNVPWRWRLYDFRLLELGAGYGNNITLRPGVPLFYAELTR